MAGDAVNRATKMVSIAEARTRRAAEQVQIAQQHVEFAALSLRAMESAREAADRALSEAQQHLAQSPGSEQHRVWLEHNRMKQDEAMAAVEQAQCELFEAQAVHRDAVVAWQRHQLRQDHLTSHAHGLSKEAGRISERRAEDELQGQGSVRALMAL